MSHPFNNIRADKVMHRRVADITGSNYSPDVPTGAGSAGTAAAIRKGASNDIMRADGGAVVSRGDRPARARGGKIGRKGKSGNTVNVIVAPGHKSDVPPMVPGVAAGMPQAMPPAPPKPMMAPPPPPGGPPGLPMPPPGMRARGGKVDASNAGIGQGRTPIQHDPGKNDLKDVGRPPVITKATGGPIDSPGAAGVGMGPKFKGGGRGGMARLQKAHRAAAHG